MRILLLSVLFVSLCLFSCQNQGVGEEDRTEGSQEYSRGFRMQKKDGYTRIEVYNPWQAAEDIRYVYYLTDDDTALPDSLRHKQIIHTPVKRIVCMSTTHVAMVTALGEGGKIYGISGAQYIYDSQIQKNFQDGYLRDVGYGNNLNYELLVQLNPDLVLLYGVGSEVLSLLAKLQDLNIPCMLIGEYLEADPLGKTEWIKVYGELLDKSREANQIFTEVKQRYIHLKDSISRLEKTKPVVMMGLPFKDVWYISPANTFAARLIEDAGGKYLWENEKGRKAVPMSLEAVYSHASNATIWINTGTAHSLPGITALDERLVNLPPVQNRRVYNNNRRINARGGNDYWESGIMKPHLILEDLIDIFHSDKLEPSGLYYYKPVVN